MDSDPLKLVHCDKNNGEELNMVCRPTVSLNKSSSALFYKLVIINYTTRHETRGVGWGLISVFLGSSVILQSMINKRACEI